MTRKILRPYQNRALTAAFNDWDSGLDRVALALATGAGKSVIFGECARIHLDAFPKPDPIVLLVHRKELVHQAAQHFRNANPDLNVVTVIGSPGPKGSTKRARTINRWRRADVLCTTPQTLASATTMSVFPNPSLIIVDEGHRAMADSYMKVLKGLGAFSGTKTLIVTATPFREDHRQFSDVAQKISYSVDTWWLITHNHDADGNEIEVAPGDGYLVEPVLHHLLVDGLDLRTVPTSKIGGAVDFREGALAEAMAEAGAFEKLIEAIRSPQFAHIRKGVIFMPTVEASKFMAEALTDAGIPAGHIDGETPPKERAETLRQWTVGTIGWTSNVDVLSEGYDLPDIEMVVLGPTRSRIKFRQRIGRGLRPAPGKRQCIILDVNGASDGMSLAGIEALTDSPTVTPGRNESLADLMDRTSRELRGRLDRVRALGDRVSELSARIVRARGQVVVTVDSLKEDMPGVEDFADAVNPLAEEAAQHTSTVAETLETLDTLGLDELGEAEHQFQATINTIRPLLSRIEDVKTKLRNSLATAQEEPASEVARALVTGVVRTVQGDLFGLAETKDAPSAPSGDINEITARSRNGKPKPVVEQRFGWTLMTSDGHLFAPVHGGGRRDAAAFAVAVKLGEDRYLPVYWSAVTGEADDFAPVTTRDDAYHRIVEKASSETEAINLINPQAAWRKAAATVGSKSYNYAQALHPDHNIPDNATAGYIGDLITLGKNEKDINVLGRWVLSVR